jgi:hypothetical protein
MLTSGDEGLDEALLKDAQHEAGQWGADRFAAEFERRDEEERRLRDAEAGIFFRYPGVSYPGDEPQPEMLSGPVDQTVHDRVVETVDAPAAIEIRKPKPIPHAHVPRPPRPDEGSRLRRGRRGRRDDRAASAGPRIPSDAELAGMSAAGRRLYGYDDPPTDRPHTKN